MRYHSFNDDVVIELDCICDAAALSRACQSYYGPDDAWKCMFAQYAVTFIETPIFALQSVCLCSCGVVWHRIIALIFVMFQEYDSWQIENVSILMCNVGALRMLFDYVVSPST